MDRTVAEGINLTFLDLSAKIDRAIGMVMKDCDKEFAAIYRQLGGMVMGLMFTNLLMTIYQEYPDLTPAKLRETRRQDVAFIPASISGELLALMEESRDQLNQAMSRVRESSSATAAGSLQKEIQEILDAVKNMAEFVQRRIDGSLEG